LTINFGALPARASFTMSSDADFYQQVDTDDGTSYPGTAVMTLVLLDAADAEVDSWSASFSGDTATFQEDKVTVAAALDDSPVQGRVYYEDGAGGPELLLAQGPIRDISP
jgi:hypothetical protein